MWYAREGANSKPVQSGVAGPLFRNSQSMAGRLTVVGGGWDAGTHMDLAQQQERRKANGRLVS